MLHLSHNLSGYPQIPTGSCAHQMRHMLSMRDNFKMAFQIQVSGLLCQVLHYKKVSQEQKNLNLHQTEDTAESSRTCQLRDRYWANRPDSLQKSLLTSADRDKVLLDCTRVVPACRAQICTGTG